MSQTMTSQVGSIQDGQYVLRGQPLSTLIQSADWISIIWLAWMGRAPSAQEREIFNACCVACVDHGQDPPSTQAARLKAKEASVSASVAAGMEQLNQQHGQAATPAAKWLQTALASGQAVESCVEQALESKTYLPGFGHRVYEVDPRVVALTIFMRNTSLKTPHLDFALKGEAAFRAHGKIVPLNIDGVLGAIVSDLAWPVELADAIFLLGRTVGLVAHVWEEKRVLPLVH